MNLFILSSCYLENSCEKQFVRHKFVFVGLQHFGSRGMFHVVSAGYLELRLPVLQRDVCVCVWCPISSTEASRRPKTARLPVSVYFQLSGSDFIVVVCYSPNDLNTPFPSVDAAE